MQYKLSKSEWLKIGEQAGWLKEAGRTPHGRRPLTSNQIRRKGIKEKNNLKNLKIRLQGETDPQRREELQKRIELAEHGAAQWGGEAPAEEGGMDKEAKCWKGYKAVGMKKKKGKIVPNCVRKES